MEYAFSELLSREDLLRILKERGLKIPDIDTLPNDDIQRIYKTFAVPLARRENRSKKIVPSNDKPPVKFEGNYPWNSSNEADFEHRDSYNAEPHAKRYKLITYEPSLTFCKKRQIDMQDSEFLCSATKHIKIGFD